MNPIYAHHHHLCICKTMKIGIEIGFGSYSTAFQEDHVYLKQIESVNMSKFDLIELI